MSKKKFRQNVNFFQKKIIQKFHLIIFFTSPPNSVPSLRLWKRYRQLLVNDLTKVSTWQLQWDLSLWPSRRNLPLRHQAKVSTWQLEWDSSLRPSRRNLPPRHQATQSNDYTFVNVTANF